MHCPRTAAFAAALACVIVAQKVVSSILYLAGSGVRHQDPYLRLASPSRGCRHQRAHGTGVRCPTHGLASWF
jgi:hypothetical protein